MADDDDDSGGWQLTESDPGVFTELLRTLHVPLVVDDLYSLDPESLASLAPIHALIFLFKHSSASSAAPTPDPRATTGTPDPSFPGFFAHQVVNNACATLAVINALGNIHPLPSSLPPSQSTEFQNLLSFTAPLDPQTRGLAITSADWLRAAHNALSPPAVLSLDGLGLQKTQEDAYHFVVYLALDGIVWELDGLREFAVSHGPYEDVGEGWLTRTRQAIEARIATYPDGAVEFSLLALHDDPLPQLRSRLALLQGQQHHTSEVAETAVQIATEEQKRERWAFENSLRKHNHLGLVHALVFALAFAGKLEDAKSKARQKMQERSSRAAGTGDD